jgi:Zn-dependent peptidase ImmA (M78 family)
MQWKTVSEALKAWRAAIEGLGVFTFQLPMPAEEVRAFSLPGNLAPALAISSGDFLVARIFSLLHELGHLLLGQAALCVPSELRSSRPRVDEERFCDQFAGAVLIPGEEVRQYLASDHAELPSGEVDRVVDRMSRYYKVSRYVSLWRLRDTQALSHARFDMKIREWIRMENSRKGRSGGGTASLGQRVLAQRGRSFVAHVLTAHAGGHISASTASEILGIGQRHLQEVEALAAG